MLFPPFVWCSPKCKIFRGTGAKQLWGWREELGDHPGRAGTHQLLLQTPPQDKPAGISKHSQTSCLGHCWPILLLFFCFIHNFSFPRESSTSVLSNSSTLLSINNDKHEGFAVRTWHQPCAGPLGFFLYMWTVLLNSIWWDFAPALLWSSCCCPGCAPLGEPRAAGAHLKLGTRPRRVCEGGPEGVTVTAEATEHLLAADSVFPGQL